ncbi:MAG: choice-of-anchor Q domain-containing protein, partial [Solirubrobacterales bacterium]
LVPAGAHGATFTVNTTADAAVVNGCVTEPVCSLRSAVIAASASPDAEDRIEVPAGNYGLSSGEELTLNGGELITIHGAGARATVIDGLGLGRVLKLAGPDVAIEGVTITGGVAGPEVAVEFAGDGGGILVNNSKRLSLNQVAVVGNSAILNGGGISAPPESGVSTAVTITNSTIAANRVSGGVLEGLGGGVYTLGDLNIVNSTITGNSVENPGLNMGGGVLAGIDPTNPEGTKATLLNSTIAGNSVAAGGSGAGFSINNPTAGVVTTFAVTNTIVAGNRAGTVAADCGGVVAVSSANNIGSDASCMFTDAASKQNTNPLLGALADNGGPTNTMALSAGSPAIDAGTNTGCPATDQRGVARPQGSACDIGAYELAPAPVGSPSANLKLTLKAKPKKFTPGKKLRFILKVTNRGPDAAAGVIVKGTAPALARKIKGPKLNGKKPCSLRKARKGKRQFTCRLGVIAAGKTKTLRVVVKTKPSSGKLRTRARVRSGVADPNLKDNKRVAVAKPKS